MKKDTNGPGGQGGGENSGKTDASGKTVITDAQTLDGTSYESSESSENALLIQNGGDVTLSNATITKTGDSSDENADFYGTNAGILVNDDGNLTLTNSKITTNGSHANGLFVYGNRKHYS